MMVGGKMLRNRFLRLALPAALVAPLLFPISAEASAKSVKRWRDCDTLQSSITTKSEYTVRPDVEGKGTYYIRVDIRWDLLQSGMWRRADNNVGESAKFTIKNQGYTYYFTHADRTGWGGAYYDRWRAHVISKLMKQRKGPDKTVVTEHLYFERVRFPEQSDPTNCGTDF
jgi:hypothetical protein